MGLPRGFSVQFWAVVAATFLGFLGIGAVLPALGPHVRNDLGGSDETVGFVIGVFSFVALGARVFSGAVADRRGRRTSFLAGLFCCAMAGAVYLAPLGITGAYLARVLQGFGEAFLYTGAATWAVELAGVHRSGQALGYVSSGIWGGMSAGPALGHWAGSFQHAALLQTLLALAGFALLIRVRESYKPQERRAGRKFLPGHMILPGLTLGVVNLHYPVVAGFLILHLAQHGNSGPMAYSAYATVILLSRFFLGSLPDRVHPRITFYVGVTCMAAGLLIVSTGPQPAVAVFGAAVLGLGFSFPWTSVLTTVLRRTPAAEHGSAMGMMGAFYDLFVGMGSFAGGAVADHYGYSAVFLLSAGTMAVAAVMAVPVFAGLGHAGAAKAA